MQAVCYLIAFGAGGIEAPINQTTDRQHGSAPFAGTIMLAVEVGMSGDGLGIYIFIQQSYGTATRSDHKLLDLSTGSPCPHCRLSGSWDGLSLE